jgi:hypothetical protein
MALTHDEITAIKKEVIAECKNIFVQIDDCSDKQEKVNSKFANDDVRIKLFEQKMKSWEWMFKLIATGTVGTLVTSILSLILK